MNKSKTIRPIILSLILLACFISAGWAHENVFELMGIAQPKRVKVAPEFALQDTHGRTVQLVDFKGKPVLLNFWATWCEPCKEELPSMQKLYENLSKEGIEVIAISIDRGDPSKVQKYVDKYHLTFPVLLDPDQKVRKNYYIMGLSTSYLIDAEGKLQGFVSGARTWDSEASRQVMLSLRK